MKKITSFVCLVIVAVVQTFAATLAWSVESTEPLEIRLGVTAPFSGDYSSYGQLIRHGVEQAVEDLSKEGFRVRVFFEDVATPGPKAISAVRKLISKDKIHGLAANFWNPAIPLMAPILMRNKIPAFHTAAADDLILEAGDFILSTNSKIKDEARRAAIYAYTELDARSASVIYISTTFGEHYSKHFIAEFEKLGGKILYNDTTLLGDTDLRSVLTKARAGNPDVLYAAYFGTNLGIVLKQAKQLGIQQPILSVYEAEDPSVLATAGRHAEGLRFFISEPEYDNATSLDTIQRFRDRHGYAPRILGRNAYDATTLMVRALSKCKLSATCTKDELYQTQDYHGLSGTFSIDPDGAATKRFILKTVRDQTFVKFGRNLD